MASGSLGGVPPRQSEPLRLPEWKWQLLQEALHLGQLHRLAALSPRAAAAHQARVQQRLGSNRRHRASADEDDGDADGGGSVTHERDQADGWETHLMRMTTEDWAQAAADYVRSLPTTSGGVGTAAGPERAANGQGVPGAGVVGARGSSPPTQRQLLPRACKRTSHEGGGGPSSRRAGAERKAGEPRHGHGGAARPVDQPRPRRRRRHDVLEGTQEWGGGQHGVAFVDPHTGEVMVVGRREDSAFLKRWRHRQRRRQQQQLQQLQRSRQDDGAAFVQVAGIKTPANHVRPGRHGSRRPRHGQHQQLSVPELELEPEPEPPPPPPPEPEPAARHLEPQRSLSWQQPATGAPEPAIITDTTGTADLMVSPTFFAERAGPKPVARRRHKVTISSFAQY
jgi:hypothetical protein